MNNLLQTRIIPIALGGEEFDLDNLQILWIDCNKIKTKEDNFKIVQKRMQEKMSLIPRTINCWISLEYL